MPRNTPAKGDVCCKSKSVHSEIELKPSILKVSVEKQRLFKKKTKKQKPPAGKEVGSHHSVVPHVAGLADGLVLLHDVRLPGEDTVALEAAEVLQVPVLALGLRVLVAEDQLRTHKRGTSAQPNPTCASCSLKAHIPALLTSSQPPQRGFSLSP